MTLPLQILTRRSESLTTVHWVFCGKCSQITLTCNICRNRESWTGKQLNFASDLQLTTLQKWQCIALFKRGKGVLNTEEKRGFHLKYKLRKEATTQASTTKGPSGHYAIITPAFHYQCTLRRITIFRFHFELLFIRVYKLVLFRFLQTEIWQRSACGWGVFGKTIIFKIWSFQTVLNTAVGNMPWGATLLHVSQGRGIDN